ncbi:MAG: hemolysin family protein [Balneolales bacterium]|nr:hemolysin family protein [Balneolales bacterium]
MNELILIVVLLFFSGFFSGSEIGYISANRLRLELKSREDTLRGRCLAYFTRNPEAYLSTTLLGNNVVNVAYATVMALVLVQPVTDFWIYAFDHIPSEAMLLLTQTVIASVLILIMGEVIPKGIFRVHSDQLVPLVVLPIAATNWILKPFTWFSSVIAQKIVRAINPNADAVEELYHRDDFENIFREIATDSDHHIDEDDSEILTNVLEMSNMRVKESMVPRIEVVAIDKNLAMNEVLELFISSGYSKLPVYEGSIDNIIGVIFAYDLFKRPSDISSIIRPVKYVPSSQRSADLLSEFRKQNISLAVVIDEYGGTAGLVTSEDLIEEVVGDIQDEYDTEETIMKRLNPTTFILSGSVEIEDIEEQFPEIGLRDDDTEFETIAGFIISEIGRIPKPGEKVQIAGLRFTIIKASHSRIEVVKCELTGSTNRKGSNSSQPPSSGNNPR